MMTRSQAYKILNLQAGATEAEIRKHFKKMALKVHPDINPSKNANEQFILLTQAMELLMSPEVPHYQHEINSRQHQRKARQEESAEERDARMREARMRYEQQKEYTFRENRQYLEGLITGRKWAVFKWIYRVAVALILVLILDVFLPFHYKKDELLAYSVTGYKGIIYDRITAVELRENGIYFAKSEAGKWITSYPDVIIKESWFLHTPVSFYSSDDYIQNESFFDFHVGSIRYFVIVLLLFPVIVAGRRKKDLLFVFLYQFSFWGVGLVEIILLLTKNRLLHLLSLGFL